MNNVLFSTTDAYYDLMYFCWLSSSKVVSATWSVNCQVLTVIGVVCSAGHKISLYVKVVTH